MKIQYLYNKDNKKLYKIINDKTMLMWYRTKQEWLPCTTTVKDLTINDYASTFEVIDELKVKRYK